MDTIASICTGPGGAIAIVRVSGPDAIEIAGKVWRGPDPLSRNMARRMTLGRAFANGDAIGEPCMAVCMPGPGSYTGEDTVELHCHGGDFAPRRVLDSLIKVGARHAEPGEFTKRAFINGKMDLTQAEAVAELISARSVIAFRLAGRQLSGSLGKGLRLCRAEILDVLAEVESRLDFPEEDLDWQEPPALISKLRDALSRLQGLAASRRDGELIREGVRAVIAGRPNSGKSSLLNLLLGYERAIVAPMPGTTRDTIEETASIGGIAAKLIDTAGIREDVPDMVESLGIERSLSSLGQAEVVLWLLDSSAPSPNAELAHMKKHLPETATAIAVWSKIDLSPALGNLPETGLPTAKVSALKQIGIEELLKLFEKAVWGPSGRHEPESAVSARHAALLEEAIPALSEAIHETGEERWELAALGLRAAASAIGRITGEDASPDILDEIFSRFCIGK